MWNISEKLYDTPYFFRRNRDLGTIFVYMGYRDVRCLPPTCTYMVRIYIYCPLINTPPPQRGVIIIQTKTSFLGVVFDVDHDSEGPRAQKAHPDAVSTNLSRRLGRPFTGYTSTTTLETSTSTLPTLQVTHTHAHTNTFTKQLPATIMFLCEPPAPLALVGALVVRRRQPVPKAGLEKS